MAYYTEQTLEHLYTIDDFPELAALRQHIPEGLFTTARLTKSRLRPDHATDEGYARAGEPPALMLSSPDSSPSPTGTVSTPASATVLPPLKPPPWPLPSQTSPTAIAPDRDHAQQTAPRRARAPESLAPLVYLRAIPFPPRHPLDKDALRSFDGGFV